MGFSHIYLTKRFTLLNHRDWVAMTLIFSFFYSKWLYSMQKKDDDEYVLQHIYTDDESDMTYRNQTNKTDGAVRRKIIFAYVSKIN